MTLTLLLLNTSCPVLANGVDPDQLASELILGWSNGAKVSCILRHRGNQVILAYSWARPAILVAGVGRGGMFLFLLFLHFHSCFSFFRFSLLSLVIAPACGRVRYRRPIFRPSVCQHLCRHSTFMSKLVF